MKHNSNFLALALPFFAGSSAFALDAASEARTQQQGAAFVMTNTADKNEILSYSRSASGMLQEYGNFGTGGRSSGGTTDPLGSQGSLILNYDHSMLFAVNAGSRTVSMCRVEGASLALNKTVHSGGNEPLALPQWGNLLYVNARGSSNIIGVRVNEDGTCWPIPQSVHTTNRTLTAVGVIGGVTAKAGCNGIASY